MQTPSSESATPIRFEATSSMSSEGIAGRSRAIGRSTIALVLAFTSGSSYARAADCHRLVGERFNQALVVEADDIAAPVTIADMAAPEGVELKTPFCRVRGVITSTADSDINFEVWLPPAGNWNGKYEGIGNGGFAGAIVYPAMYWALEGGYAVSGTDTGHSGLMKQSGWALRHPEKVEDLGWRAIHETALASKSIVEAYFGSAPSHSYFSGCSTGGRQGLVEAQRFPTDYNGIVVGAPAIYWPQLLASDLQTLQAASMPESWVSPQKLDAVHKAALEACHAENGVISNPSECHFDPVTLLCKKGQIGECLTDGELATVQIVYKGLQDASGKSIYPGFPPGTESNWSKQKMGTSRDRVTESGTYPFPTGFFRDVVFWQS
jgi:hypothetical protein